MAAGNESQHLVLIVDDREEVVAVLRGLLALDHRVLTATSADEALEILAENKVDLIVTDQRMPGMSGIELLRRSKETHPDCVRILLTAYADLELAVEAINSGEVYRFVQKPWDPRHLRSIILQGFERQDLGRQNQLLCAELTERNLELNQTITELQETRDKLVRSEKLALVGRLASGIVHDINNHLTCLLALEARGQPGVEDPRLKIRELVHKARGEIQSMLAELGDFARGQERPMRTSPCRVDEVIEEAVLLASRAEPVRDRELRVDCQGQPICQINTGLMKQVLVNLLKNAANATGAGDEIEVRLTTRGDRVEIAVTDQGTGIPPDQLDRIWEPFYTSDPQIGTGLGLAMCKRVVERHGGVITCQSEPGQGATFVVQLPVG